MLEYERIALSRLLARIAPYPWRYLDSKLLKDGTVFQIGYGRYGRYGELRS